MCVPREVLAKFVGREMIAVRILASDSDFRGNFNKGRDCALESCGEASYEDSFVWRIVKKTITSKTSELWVNS